VRILLFSQQPLFGAKPHRAVPAETALLSGNESKVRTQSEHECYHQQSNGTDQQAGDQYCDCSHEPPKGAVLTVDLVRDSLHV
jgi:hypothetical protein